MANAALRGFEHALVDLRRCLEAEGCHDVVDYLLRWSEGGSPGLEPRHLETLRQAVFLKITRPLPLYFEGVRSLWLGDQERAAKSFRTYLKLLPEPDPLSKAHEFLAGGASSGDGKPWPSLAGSAANAD